MDRILARMRDGPVGVNLMDLAKVRNYSFGGTKPQGTPRRVYRMPWRGDLRVNIWDDHGKAKPYQVRQVLAAIEKLEG